MSKPPAHNPPIKPTELLKASYKTGHASGRLEAIEEGMDAVAVLIFKAEALQAKLDENADATMRENARHTLQALHLAFAAVTGAVNGSAAFRQLLDESRQRCSNTSNVVH